MTGSCTKLRWNMRCLQQLARVLFVTALALAGCASVEPGPGGSGGTAGTAGTGGEGGVGGVGGSEILCGQGTLEDNDTVDESTGIASGTVNGTCQVIGEEIDCQGPDLVDEWFLTAVQDGARTIELSWSNATSDLDLGVFDAATCEVLEASVSRVGTKETINMFLEDGAEVIITVLSYDTNSSAEPYEVLASDGTSANGI
jgi:hypothetical protein